jgi:FMN-dependent dehydrogenase
VAHGSDSEFTLRRNREAFQWVELVERPGASAASVNTATEVLGIKMDYTVFVAPNTRPRDLYPDGDPVEDDRVDPEGIRRAGRDQGRDVTGGREGRRRRRSARRWRLARRVC